MSAFDTKIIKKQKAFFNSGVTKDYAFRIKTLNSLSEIISNNENEILSALKKDLRKNKTEAYTSEIFHTLNEIKSLQKGLKKWLKPVKARTPMANFPGKSYYIKDPFGSVLIISPWNYPFNLVFSPLAGAVAAGNCAIIKPSEQATATSSLITKLISDKFNDEHIAVVEGGKEVTKDIIGESPDFIFFTGSSAVGREIMHQAAYNLIPLVLELGGKNPCIIDKNVNIEVAIRRILWGKFFNAGQTCVAPDYLLVDENIKNNFEKTMARIMNDFYESEESRESFTAIVNEKHFIDLEAMLAEGKILAGGRKDKNNLVIWPTVITDIAKKSKVMQEEIFGPILPITYFSSLDKELENLKNKPSPLATYFFSRNKKLQEKVINDSMTGSVCINGTIHILVSNSLPFGGKGLSGFGSYHGKHSFDTFTYKKAVLKKSFWFDLKTLYPPYKVPLDMLKKALKIFS